MASRYLNNITINDAYTLPSADGTNGQIITTDGSGILSFADAASSDAIVLTVKNVSGGSLSKGTVVYVSPSANPPSGNVIEVSAADNSSASTMPALAVLNATLADDAEGEAIAFGQLSGIDTSAFTVGNAIYVNTSGGFTATKPTGTALIQKLGMVVKSHASNGAIKIFGAFRSNDVPNILQDYIWLGNSSGVATPTEHLLNNVKDVTTSSPTDGQVLTWDNTNSYWKNADATGGGGGSATLAVDQQTFDGDNSTVAFTLSTTCESENNLQVYIDGVYQSKNNFSVSGTTLTFSTAPPTGTNNIEVIHITSMAGSVEVDTFTGDGSDVTFDLSTNISTENNTQVFLDGVYQSKGNYSISGATITFSTAPANSVAIEVVHFLPSGDFTISAVDSGDDAIIRLSGTNGFTDDVKLVAGSNITVTPSGDDITIASTASGGTDWQTTAKTAAFTAVAGEGYFVNTTSAAITVTLPSSPTAGDEVSIVDYAGTADTNNITITSSNNINGASDDVLIDYERGGVSMVYVDATQGWIAYNAANETNRALTPDLPLTVDYLVVAGGGSGSGSHGGGGGAGGLRTSYGSTSGGGASAESSLSLATATSYTITIGAGGSAPSPGGNNGNSGSNSVFANITSIGGGWGQYSSSGNAGSGGSGGGSSYGNSGGSGTANQGYAGGNGISNYENGAGGGGASQTGYDNTSSAGGNGGNGLAVEITGSAVTYAGGGGGGINAAGGGSSPGSGGTGGGGSATTGTGQSGTVNTGGGGSGGYYIGSHSTGGSGGSGVVILRYPNIYTVTIGSGLTGSTATDGTSKVTTFTAGTGNISFS